MRRCYAEPSIVVVSVERELLTRALDLYERRGHKELTDCISFVVMRDRGLMDAAPETGIFARPGFRPLMLEAE